MAKYCTPIWEDSHHCNLIDMELRKTMRIISGTVKSTPMQWLPVLANIEPPHIRRQNAVLRIAKKIASNTNLPIHEYRDETPRLKLRHPFLERVKSIKAQLGLKPSRWQEEWKRNLHINENLIKDLHLK